MIRYLDIKAMCEKLGGTRPLHPATIHRGVQAGTLPPPIKLGRVARWREDEVDTVLQRLADARDSTDPITSYGRAAGRAGESAPTVNRRDHPDPVHVHGDQVRNPPRR